MGDKPKRFNGPSVSGAKSLRRDNANARYDDRRESASKRGYNRTWQRLRKLVLHRQPVCVMCQENPTEEIDHIKPLAKGGDNSMENLQGLCKSCHSRKTHTVDYPKHKRQF